MQGNNQYQGRETAEGHEWEDVTVPSHRGTNKKRGLSNRLLKPFEGGGEQLGGRQEGEWRLIFCSLASASGRPQLAEGEEEEPSIILSSVSSTRPPLPLPNPTFLSSPSPQLILGSFRSSLDPVFTHLRGEDAISTQTNHLSRDSKFFPAIVHTFH